MDGGFEIDSTELNETVKNIDVISILFPLIRRSLVIDLRYSATEEPMVRLMPQAGSLEERARSIRRARPTFSRPDNMAAFPWPKYVASLMQTEAFGIIRVRLEDLGFRRPLHSLSEALEQIQRLERKELAAVLQGDHYQTIWSNSG